MIIIGYPGIGKSTLVKNQDNNDDYHYIDLENSRFWVQGEYGRRRDPAWAEIYVKIAIDLESQGNDVFVSSHEEVRRALIKYASVEGGPCVISICPAIELRDDWLGKLEDRFNKSGLKKDEDTLNYVREHFTENILAMKNDPIDCYSIDDITYSLPEILYGIRDYIYILPCNVVHANEQQ